MTRRCAKTMLLAGVLCAAEIAWANQTQDQPPATSQTVSQPGFVEPRRPGRRRTVRRRVAPRALPAEPQSPPAGQVNPQPLPPSTAQPAPAEPSNAANSEPRIAPPSPLPTLMLQPPANSPGTPAPFSTKVNINRATLEQIQRLPGMTPGVAARVLAGRPYRRIGELGAIGIPPEIILSIAPVVSFDP